MNIIEDLQEIVQDYNQVSINESILEQHSKGLLYHTPHLPDVVVYPKSKEEVSKILIYANERKIPITPFGVGSSLEGQIIPTHGGISMDFSLMNKVVRINEEDFLVKVEPGITRNELNKQLKKYGLFFPVDPGADATIGGMAATGASGTNSVKYGTMKDYVKGLEVVLANGEIIKTGGMATKSSSGYNLTELFVGSEGTLGVFTEITLKLVGIEEETVAIKANFPTIDLAAQSAFTLLKSGIEIGKIELVDAQTIKAVNEYKETTYPETATLFIELSGSKEMIDYETSLVKEILMDENCTHFELETDSVKKAKLWEARHHVAFAVQAAHPGKSILSTDVCVPLSKLPEAIKYSRIVLDEANINGGIFGHVGDGNFHTVITFDPNNPKSIKHIEKVNGQIVDFALANGGTCTGEHGIGIGKKEFLEKEHPTSISLMKGIKHLLDPNSIMNPDKVL